MSKQTTDAFLLSGKDAQAEGELTDAGFLVRAGAIARKEIVPSASDTVTPVRDRLLAEGVLVEEPGGLRFAKDHLFDSPSGAAAAVLGRSANGWQEWKHADGRTLSEVKRVTRSGDEAMLSESKREKILAKHKQLVDEGRIYTETQLDKHYSVFRSRFGPDALTGLDGEALLEFMHDHGNKDSLVYWLEFKNDDEFDTRRFGSIAGGSALKFRVFRRKETGNWQAGGEKGNRPEDITVQQAVEIARTHRAQLLKGGELLRELPANATDDDYAHLQDQMDELAPDVSKLAWGHKYFSLLFPDKLDDYHIPELQRFHLLKLLQLPPEGDGRYICAGRFVSAAREVDFPMNHLASCLNSVQGRLHRYWRVGTTSGKTNVSHWQMMQDRNCVAIGWNKTGNLSWVEAKKASRQKLKALLNEKHPNHPTAIGNDCSQITQFIATINEGDIVLAAKGMTILGVGRIAGEYRFEPEFDFPHQRPVEWLELGAWKMPVKEGLQTTVREIRRYYENILEVERRIQDAASKPVRRTKAVTPGKVTVRLSGIPGRIQSVLDRKSQVILYGPPGTGKTYWAERAANDLAALSAFGKTYDDLADTEKIAIVGNQETSGIVRLCCFHPAYGYEDFLEGYRPLTTDGQVSFELRDGVFKKICRDAGAAPNRNFYLIVDEINRGDIPRIFGELLTTLEKDKRRKRIVLPVSQEVFVVPHNVFIIGTMNTADRSISLLDAALRRRFGFIELMPDGTVLRDSVVAGIPLRAWFDALNARIREHVGRDARNLQIGHSYLLQAGSPIKELAALKRALRDDIVPLLEEYCYEDFSALQSILGKGLLDIENQQIRQDLFADGQEEELKQALLEPCPEISTSSEALSSEEETAEEATEEVDADEDED